MNGRVPNLEHLPMTDDEDPDKSLFEVLFAALEEANKNPPPPLTQPTQPFDPRAFDEAYAKLVPPRQYRPASEFANELDAEARADALYQAWLVGDIDLLCPSIRALIADLRKTFSGFSLHAVANPASGTKHIRTPERKRPKNKHAKLASLFDDD
jgi:hypothetical protein